MGHVRQSILFILIVLLVSSSAFANAGETTTSSGESEPQAFEWDVTVDGPLPRWRIGPDGENATPPHDPDQPLTPYRIDIASRAAAHEYCLIDSPAEYEPMAGVLFQYSTIGWPDLVAELVAHLTGDPADDEIAYVVVSDSTQQASAEADFTAAGADLSKVEFLVMPNNSIWIRDYGPHFIWQGGADAIVDSHYYPDRPLDNFIPTLVADDYFVNPSHDIPLIYSGGNFLPSQDRQGFVTALIRTDNPGFSDETIAALYDEYQGIDTLHIFPRLPGSVDGTGHIDMWFYLVDEDTVIIAEFLPGSNQDAIDITNNAVPYMEDLGYEVFRVPAFNASNPGGSSHYTYTNAFRVNDRIYIPSYGEGDPEYVQYDDQALAAWQQAAGPSVEIVPVNCYDIIWAAGAIHCIVMQVPRYTDALPSACATSPGGGEVLVPGTAHEITWTAADDGSVSTIDLYYSVDGGATYPPEQMIATGLADDGRHSWTVAQAETSQARVKVVATDDEANSVEVQSESDVTFESALRHVYDFSTGAGVDKWIYGDATSSWASLDGVRRPPGVNTELSSADYSRIAASDAVGGDGDPNRYASPGPGFFNESTHILELVIDEDPAQIVDIAILWEGYADSCIQAELYVWDYVASQWCDGRGGCGENAFVDNFAGNRDDDLTGHIRSDFDRYIDGSGTMTLLVYVEDAPFFSSYVSFHDYVSVTVTYDVCAGADFDFDGWADACDNCVATPNDQVNSDTDAYGDACDCAPTDGTAFSVPFEIGNARLLGDKTTLEWDSDAENSGSGTTYDVMRGNVGQFPVGTGANETCVDTGLTETSLGDLETPPAGTGHYYLVRGTNVCGAGTYGSGSGTNGRDSDVCP